MSKMFWSPGTWCHLTTGKGGTLGTYSTARCKECAMPPHTCWEKVLNCPRQKPGVKLLDLIKVPDLTAACHLEPLELAAYHSAPDQ
jgi:hypothetical protein